MSEQLERIAGTPLKGLAWAVVALLASQALWAGPQEQPRAVGAGADGRFRPIGSDACRACHRAVWQAWSATPHARAAEVLSFDQRFDPDCQPCHSPFVESEPGVGCESCHAPGSAYSELAVMIDPMKRDAAGLAGGDRCDRCHNPAHPFHVERDLAALAPAVHPAPAIRVIF